MNVCLRFVIAAFLAAAIAVPAGAAAAPRPVEAMFANAVSEEAAVRTALASPNALPTVLKAVHAVVGDFEAIVRAYPTSSYCDDALWRAGLMSIEAFKKFDDARERDAAVRLLHLLASQYPSSKLAKNVRATLATIPDAPPAPAAAPSAAPARPASAPAVAPARPAAPATTGSTSRVTPPSAPGNKLITPPVRVATITAVDRVPLPDAIRITIQLDAEAAFRYEQIDAPSRIVIDFASTKAAPALQEKTIRFDADADPVRHVRFGAHDTTTRVVLDATGIGSYSVYPLYNPYRLVIDCVRAPAPSRTTPPVAAPHVAPRTTGTGSKPAAIAARQPVRPVPPPLLKSRALVSDFVFSLATTTSANGAVIQHLFEPDVPETAHAAASSSSNAPSPATPPSAAPMPDKNLAGGFSIARQLGAGVSRIVIDPGHGGRDPGAQGKGVSEAELTLDVALRLEKLLKKVPGVDVILTRRSDDFVPLQERTAIANREHADLFLSIHANASQNETARGIETYYLNFASNMNAAAVAARENAASGSTMAGVPDFVKSIALNNKLDESREFATDVQRAMIEKLRASNKDVKDLGVKQAPFMVLIGAAMPSVLAEMSFVTNGQEARLLKSAAYRERIAEALFAAVRKYQTSLKNVQTAAREP